MKIQPIAIIFVIAFLATNYSSFAAGMAPPPPGGGSPSCWPPPCIPIDGGITFLLVAGAAYGTKKVYDLKKNKVNP